MKGDEFERLEQRFNQAKRLVDAGELSAAFSLLEDLRLSDEAFALAFLDLMAVYRFMLDQVEDQRRALQASIEKLHYRHASVRRKVSDAKAATKSVSRDTLPNSEVIERGPKQLYPTKVRRGKLRGKDDNAAPLGDVPPSSVTADEQQPLEFIPHLDLLPNVSTKEIVARVFLDRSAFREGEFGEPVVAQPGAEVHAQLIATAHFEIIGSAHRNCIISLGQERQSFDDFLVRPRPDAINIDVEPAISVLFTVDSRPSGTVKRRVDLQGHSQPLDDKVEPDTVQFLRELGEKADLSITVMSNPINDGRQFDCIVSSPHLPSFVNGKSAPWNLSERSEAIVAKFMQGFTDPTTKTSGLIAALRGAGKELFDASPIVFQEAFWEMMAGGKPLATIAIVSEEPFIPWELMVPNGGPDDVDRDTPLGVDYTVGRWILKAKAARRSIKISDSRVFAPKYSGKLVLGMAEAEADAVIKVYPGKIVSPVSFDQLADEMLGGPSLIHFICHGKDDTANGQFILLDDDQKLTDTNLRGISGLATVFKTKAPIVFLNACEVGRGNPSLVGPRGFAAQFIKLGAQAVIAPLWSVDDKIAHEIAVEFYDQVKKQPGRRLAEIFKEIRSRAYKSGRDSYAAYCFFGDPLAVAA
ncbi:CHAT domain-containing protein [Rhizobium leguminosarum]|uniref:CHAT domain-containing protein n=1 Tax=Rhizobium leguminosarum TaxID=384 RepID=UPI001C989561|nr:CHAT domain-containing protein [Rhizobium leguminosarum]MBY5533632.1 CHAT domain-containing protein [Rhizobium leguminosarum]